MPISDSVTMGGAGNYLPYYAIPSLNATLSNWQAGVGLEQFNFSSQQRVVQLFHEIWRSPSEDHV